MQATDAKPVCRRLRHTSDNPGEWIGETISGDAIYVIARMRKELCWSTSRVLNDAIRAVMTRKCVVDRHQSLAGNSLTTDEMLKATGIKVKDTVNESIPGTLSAF